MHHFNWIFPVRFQLYIMLYYNKGHFRIEKWHFVYLKDCVLCSILDTVHFLLITSLVTRELKKYRENVDLQYYICVSEFCTYPRICLIQKCLRVIGLSRKKMPLWEIKRFYSIIHFVYAQMKVKALFSGLENRFFFSSSFFYLKAFNIMFLKGVIGRTSMVLLSTVLYYCCICIVYM